MRELPKILTWKYADEITSGYLIKRNNKDFLLCKDYQDLTVKFEQCYFSGDPDNAYRGGKVSNPIKEKYFNNFITNNICKMPNYVFTLIKVDIPLWDGKEQGFYYKDEKLIDMNSLYRNYDIAVELGYEKI